MIGLLVGSVFIPVLVGVAGAVGFVALLLGHGRPEFTVRHRVASWAMALSPVAYLSYLLVHLIRSW